MATVSLECFCGQVKGELRISSPKKFFHVHCLCSDCQKFAAFLGQEEKILDQYGASELFQTYPCNLQFTQGEDKLTNMKLSDKGLIRWYTSCCRTPVANTLPYAKVPFAGVSVKLMKFTAVGEKEQLLGPVILKAFGKSAKGGKKPKDAHEKFPKSFLPKILRFMAVGLISQSYKPSPFFKHGKLRVTPKVP